MKQPPPPKKKGGGGEKENKTRNPINVMMAVLHFFALTDKGGNSCRLDIPPDK